MPQQTLNTPRETTHQRIAAALEAIEQNMSDEHEAVNIDYDNTTSGLNANKVQSAIDELALAGFVTNTVNNLVNYYLKSETYNKAEVDSLINAVKNSRFEAVSTLPTTNIKTNVIYLVPKSPTQTNNAKDEYINLDGTSSGWEKIGDTEVDLSGYVTTTALNTALSNYTTTANLTNLLNNKVDKVNGKGLSTNDYTTAEKTKLAGISEGATQTIANPADTATETLSKLEVGGVVYDVPQGASGATELSELTDVNLTDVEDNDILQYDETANKWKNSNALQGAKTATGNPITVTDAAPVNAVNLSMDLEPVQDLHGYDHPWVGGAGKNKLPMTVEGLKAANGGASTWNGNSKTIGGVAFTILTDSDGNVTSIKADGTASESVTFNIFNGNAPLNGRYTLWSNYFLANGQAAYTFVFSTHENVNIINTQEITDTFTDDVLTHMHIFIWGGTQVNNVTFQPMITFSSESSTFEPYTNICPISGRSEVAIERVGGRNFIPMTVSEIKETNTQGTWNGNVYTRNDVVVTLLTNNDEEVTGIHVNGTPSTGFNFSLCKNQEFPQGSYILNGNPSSSIDTFSTGVIRMTSPVGSIGEDIGSGANINIESGILYYIRISFNTNKAVNNKTFYPMLRLSTDTNANFEPFHFKTYTIQIGQTVYGCHYDVTRGKMVVMHGKVVYDGSSDEAWSSELTVNNVYRKILNVPSNMKLPSSNDTAINALSNQYVCKSANATYLNQIGFSVQSDGAFFAVYDSQFYTSDTSLWTTYLASNPLEVVYELATPFTIDLTPQQIKMLENTNTISTDYEGDTITIEYQPNNSIGEAVRVVEESYDAELEYLKPTGSISSGDTKAVTGGVVYDYHNTTPLNPKANLYIEKSGNVINIEARDVDGSAFTSYPGAGGYTLPTGYRPKRMLIVCVYVYTTYDNKKHHGIIKIRDDGTMDGHFIDFSGNEHKIYDSSYSSEVSFNTSYIV